MKNNDLLDDACAAITPAQMEEARIHALRYAVSSCEGITKAITACKLRGKSLPDAFRYLENKILAGGNDTVLNEDGDVVVTQAKGLAYIKGMLEREIEKCLRHYPIWSQWAVRVHGVGPVIMGRLVLAYYHRFIPICKKCGGDLEKREKSFVCTVCKAKAKGDGLVDHRIEERDFPNISKWWKYCGMHVNAEGVKPKRKAGELSDWSTKCRTACFHLGTSFVKQSGSPYRAYYDERKAYRAEYSQEKTPKHRDNMARNETAKLFLAHFWLVARELDNKPITEPYAIGIQGHTGFIPPYYWPRKK